MLLTSYGFIGFFAILVILYYVLPKRAQAPLLLVASFLYYATAGAECLIFLIFSILTVWFASLRIGANFEKVSAYLKANKETLSKEEKKAYKKSQEKVRFAYFLCALLLNLIVLALVKLPLGHHLTILGISFYTFQSLGYLIDVYREAYPPQKSLWKYALFVSFFPQLIQGPISRYGDLSKTLYDSHPFDADRLWRGLSRILWGFFKKLVIADRLLIAVNTLIGDPATYNGGYVFYELLFYTVELYADFTGGIDIVIGAGEVLGITVAENFNRPYFSTSLAEYWRRWHISMCSWFRDYLFYPVSTSPAIQKFSKWSRKHFGDKAGRRLPVYVSSFIVWTATGLWHGASLNFIVWGLLNFAVLMISEEFGPLYEKFHGRFAFSNTPLYEGFRILRTFALICVLNLFDCFTSIRTTLGLLLSLVTGGNRGLLFNGSLLTLGITGWDYLILGIGALMMLTVSLVQTKGSVRDRIGRLAYPVRFLLWSGLFIIILIFGIYGIGYDATQFIYNRF